MCIRDSSSRDPRPETLVQRPAVWRLAQAAKDRKERKKVLYRYIPDVARAVFGVLEETAAKGKSTRR
eukprot:8085296-Pyramimonas_sp.AAC.2